MMTLQCYSSFIHLFAQQIFIQCSPCVKFTAKHCRCKVTKTSPCISGAYSLVRETDIKQVIMEGNIESQPGQIYEGELISCEVLYLEGYCHALVDRKSVKVSLREQPLGRAES